MPAKPCSDAVAVSLAPAPAPAPWRRPRIWRSLQGTVGLLALLTFVTWSVDFLNIDVERLPGILGRLVDVLSRRYFPPDLGHIARAGYLASVGETFQMSYAASVVGMLVAVPLAWFASFNLSPSRRLLYPLARLIIMSCRAVHEMIWTILVVEVLGFGMLPGTVAMTLFCIGFSGKLFTEAVEAIQPGQVEAIRATGANELQVFVFAALPQVRVAWTGIAIYSWDVVFRAATVVGFFGAGGMGAFLRESVQRVESHQVAAILLSIIVIVLIAELFSAWVRDRMVRAVA